MRLPPASRRNVACPSHVSSIVRAYPGRAVRRRRERMPVGSRLLPPALAVCALLADAGGVHGLAGWLVLIALPCAAGAAFVAVSDLLEGKSRLPGVTST